MEDKSLGKLAGISSIFSKTGGYEPFYSYRRVTESNYCKLLNRTQTVETLQLSRIHDGPTEIGSPFLDAQYRGRGRGRQFFEMDFPQADILSTHSKRFIEDWFPKYPIYVNLLPDSVRQFMGQVHQNSKPAMEMLRAEGFVQTEMIHIFDGGLHCAARPTKSMRCGELSDQARSYKRFRRYNRLGIL